MRSWRVPIALLIASVAVFLAFPLSPGRQLAARAAAALRGQLPASWPVALGEGAVQAGVLLLLAGAAALMPRPAPQSTPWRTGDATALAVGLLLLLLPLVDLLLLSLLAVHPMPGAIDLVLPQPPGQGAAALIGRVLLVVVLAPLAEEWFFRGRLLPWLAQVNAVTAVSASALLFAACHGSLGQLVFGLPIGILLGIVRLKTGRLYPCIAAHGVHNAAVLLVGGAVTASKMVLLVDLVGGAWLLAFAWAWHRQDHLAHGNRRSALAVGVSLAVALALWPLLRAAHHATWIRASAGLLLRIEDWHVAAQRLARAERRGELTGPRRVGLAERLALADQRPFDRRLGFCAVLDPETFLGLARPALACGQLEVMSTLADLEFLAAEADGAACAGRWLAAAAPDDFAGWVVSSRPDLARFYHLPAHANDLADVLARLDGLARSGVLKAVLTTRGWTQAEVVDAVLRLPPAVVGPRDRYLMRLHVVDFDERLGALIRTDPVRVAAWR